ncbi:MAG TPA: SPFH domain-containing protein [Woeseiaceae bacterium]|nr:SPFH domain-containing protein [Woeseiaceae bacterium]
MPAMTSSSTTHEREIRPLNGWAMLVFNIAVMAAGAALLAHTIAVTAGGSELGTGATVLRIIAAALIMALAGLLFAGHFTLQPNEARVLILFGSYKGTARTSGFHWANPLYSRNRGSVPAGSDAGEHRGGLAGIAAAIKGRRELSAKLSLRAHNFNSDKLKVNDKRGNPVEIAAVVVWRVDDTAQAAFDVDDYESYVQVQSESAIRSIASRYAYDHGEEREITLRDGGDEVAAALEQELGARLDKAGVIVEEARLTHLAYAPEIAPAMLRRQQAEAIIAARRAIVLGAVSMVGMALRDLDEKQVVTLDDERKAAMVSNLMVVLCGTSEAAPVINTGTLYT